MPGRMDVVHPALDAEHGVIVVPGNVYAGAHVRIVWVPEDSGAENAIQLIPLEKFTLIL